MLVGSFASTYYGAARSTQNIDLMIRATPAQLRAFAQSLPSEEYYVDLGARGNLAVVYILNSVLLPTAVVRHSVTTVWTTGKHGQTGCRRS